MFWATFFSIGPPHFSFLFTARRKAARGNWRRAGALNLGGSYVCMQNVVFDEPIKTHQWPFRQ